MDHGPPFKAPGTLGDAAGDEVVSAGGESGLLHAAWLARGDGGPRSALPNDQISGADCHVDGPLLKLSGNVGRCCRG